MPDDQLYLDYHATTPCAPVVLEAMLPWFSQHFGNASSRLHAYGRRAADAVALAREQVSALIGASPEEIIFTSGATESINLALKGAAQQLRHKGQHIITLATEHAAVLDTCKRLEQWGFEISYLPVQPNGLLHLGQLQEALRPDTILVAVMTANNETGVLQDMAGISAITHAHGAWLFTDATQAVGKIPFTVDQPKVDLAAFSAHKMYGPKGVGALYLRRRDPRVQVQALLDGGGHERGLRSGTLNVPGIVGFGAAARYVGADLELEGARQGMLRDRFEAGLRQLDQVWINGVDSNRLPGVSNFSAAFTEGQALHAAIAREIALSAGSACASATLEPSHVLTAMGHGRELAFASMRLSLGRPTDAKAMQEALDRITFFLEAVRRDSPTWSLFRQGLLRDSSPWAKLQ